MKICTIKDKLSKHIFGKTHKEMGTKRKSIRINLYIGFFFPVLMLVVLGVISYTTASQTIMEKYEESSLNTITAMSTYGENLVDSIASRALEQAISNDLEQYYETYADNKDEAWIDMYSAAKTNLLQVCNSTSYISNCYTIPKAGSSMSSLGEDLSTSSYDEFMASDIGTTFEKNISLKNGWFGHHKSIDNERNSDGTDYAFTYVQKMIRTNTFLVFDWSMDSAEHILQKIQFGEDSISALVSADGREVARIRRTDANGSTTLEELDETVFVGTDFWQTSINQNYSLSGYVTWNNDKYLYVYSPMGDSGISLCSLIPQKNIIAEVVAIRNLTIVIVVVAVVIAVLLGSYIASGISKTVSVISNVLEKVADGDLTQKFVINRNDEFGTLGRVLNNTINNIRILMTDMKHFGSDVNQMADSVSEKTDAFNESIQNISIGVSSVANGLQVQATETDKSSNKMHEFAMRLDDIHRETVQMSGAINSATDAIKQGQIIIQDLSDKAQTTANITNVLVENVNGVQEHSVKIESIIDTINGIATQTNLLSLNASIEAARAGEHGRGFAVVAEEIRNLAVQTSEASGEVQQLLNQMAVMTEKTTQSTEETQHIVIEQGDALNRTISVFRMIEEMVAELVSGLQAVVNAMEQINTDKDEIQASVVNISEEAETAAASTEEVTSSLDEQAGVMAKLATDIEHLRRQTAVLDEAINRFKIQ